MAYSGVKNDGVLRIWTADWVFLCEAAYPRKFFCESWQRNRWIFELYCFHSHHCRCYMTRSDACRVSADLGQLSAALLFQFRALPAQHLEELSHTYPSHQCGHYSWLKGPRFWCSRLRKLHAVQWSLLPLEQLEFCLCCAFSTIYTPVSCELILANSHIIHVSYFWIFTSAPLSIRYCTAAMLLSLIQANCNGTKPLTAESIGTPWSNANLIRPGKHKMTDKKTKTKQFTNALMNIYRRCQWLQPNAGLAKHLLTFLSLHHLRWAAFYEWKKKKKKKKSKMNSKTTASF